MKRAWPGTALVLCLLSAAADQAAGFVTPITTRRVYPPPATPTSLVLPLFVVSPPGDMDRLFIVEQRQGGGAPLNTQGRIRILDLDTEALLGSPFLSTTSQSISSEEGLLGLAFHPDYFADAPNPNRAAFFIYITIGGNNRVVRYVATGQDPAANTADSTSAQLVINFSHPTNSNHNGGWIAFGPDGYLYIATGDGGSACDPPGNGQNINAMLGKMHRLDVDTDQNPGDPADWGYTEPATNPFVGVGGQDEIWHYGLRNPWRCSFDRLTGDLYIGDVGQNAREEISFALSGVGGINYGWDVREGFVCSNVASSFCTSTCSTTGRTDPIWDFNWSAGSAVTGGYVYRGPTIPDLQGTYFYANYGNAQIWSFAYTGVPLMASDITNRTSALDPDGPGGMSIATIVSFGEDAAGEMYIVDQNGGEIFKIITDCENSALAIDTPPSSQNACVGDTVVFSVVASDLRGLTTYTWRKDGDVVGGNSPTLTLLNVSGADEGDYTVTLEDQCGSVEGGPATLTVIPLPLGDIDADCLVDLVDAGLLVDILLDLNMDPEQTMRANVNGVGGVDGQDVQAFIEEIVP